MFQIIGSHSGHQACISLFGGPRAASTSKNRTLFSSLGPRRGIETPSPDSLGVLCQHPGNSATGRFCHGGILQLMKTSFRSANEFSLSKKTPLGLRLWLNDLGPKKTQSPLQNTKTIGEKRRGAQIIVLQGSLSPSWVTCEASPVFSLQKSKLLHWILAFSQLPWGVKHGWCTYKGIFFPLSLMKRGTGMGIHNGA